MSAPVSTAATASPDTARRRRVLLYAALAGLALWALAGSLFSVDVTEYALVTRFGRLVQVHAQPGLRVKAPFDRVVRLDQRVVATKPARAEYLSVDKKNLVIEALATWRIVEPERFLATLATRASADAQIADVASAEIGAVLGQYPAAALIAVAPLSRGYEQVVARVRAGVARFARGAYGVEVLSVDILALSLPEQNKEHVFDRMKAERGKMAKELRSSGELEAKKIIAAADRERTRIEADAQARAARFKAEGDAQAARIYADAYTKSAGFYKFLRTLQAYEKFLDDTTTLFLPADAEVFALLRPEGRILAPSAPAPIGGVMGKTSAPRQPRPATEKPDTAAALPPAVEPRP